MREQMQQIAENQMKFSHIDSGRNSVETMQYLPQVPSKKTVTGQVNSNLLGAQNMYNANRPITANNVQGTVIRQGSLAKSNMELSTT
jgi:hypothetical protein